MTAPEVEVAAAPILRKSWNDTVSQKLPKPVLNEDWQRLISNTLWFVIVLQSVPSATFAINIFSSGKAGGFVVWAIILQIFVSICWILYGLFVVRNALIISASTLLVTMNTTLLVSVLRARRNSKLEDGGMYC